MHSNTTIKMAGKDNKRKRDSADVDKPSKKASASSASIKVQFPSLQDELHPVIGMKLKECQTAADMI